MYKPTYVDKIMDWPRLAKEVCRLKAQGRKIVFTNGCFDLLHTGHTHYLDQARSLGDALVVGLNSDRSVKANKGDNRPIRPESQRAEVMAALASVDLVTFFDDETPAELIELVAPEVLVKGGDWSVDNIVGADFVLAGGGRVESLPLVEGEATTAIIKKIVSVYGT